MKNLFQQVQYGNTYGYLGSLGFVVMATDTVMQENLRTLAPDDVSKIKNFKYNYAVYS